jgi:hypothetical protein
MKKNEREVKPRLLPDKITKKLLLSLPKRDWSKVSIYDQIYLVPEGGKHDSGFMFIAIIGVSKREFKNKSKYYGEIAGYCDDVCWDTSLVSREFGIRTDCEYPSGILHFWSWYCKFQVGHSLSSTDIKLIPEIETPSLIKKGKK